MRMRSNETVDKEPDGSCPTEQLLPYAGGDVDADLQVAAGQKRGVAAGPERLTSFYVNILHPAARAFE